MGQPADSIALAAARRVLHQIVMANALAAGRGNHLPHRLQLVVTGKDHRLLAHLLAFIADLFLDIQMKKTRQQIKQAVALTTPLPTDRRSCSCGLPCPARCPRRRD